MLTTYKAIVLRSIKHGESGLITQAYTDIEGRQSFLIHGVRKKKSKISAYLFQPLSLLSVEAYRKESRDLNLIKEVHPLHHFSKLHFDIKRSTVAQFIGEIIYKCLRENESNTDLFNYLVGAIQILDMAEENIENFHLIFLIQFTRFIGIYPKDNADLYRYHTDTEIGLSELIQYSLSNLKELKIDAQSRSVLLNQLLQYYYDHHEGMGEIKSLSILKEVFHS